MSPALREWQAPQGRAGSRLRALLPPWRGWPRRASQHTLFVQPDGVWAWAPPPGGHSAGVGPGAPPTRHDSAAAWMQAHAGSSVRLVLSGLLLHHLVMRDASLPLHDTTEIAAYARHQFVHYHGSGAQAWPLAVWDEVDQRGVCALHGLDLAELIEQAGRCKIKLASITPWWAVALRTAHRLDPAFSHAPCAALLLAEGCLLTCLTSEHGRLVDVEQRRLDEATLAAAQLSAREWQAEQAGRAAMPVTPLMLTGYGLSVAHTQSAALTPLQVLGDVDRLQGANPHHDWLRA